jgi:hypothetical protein
MGKCVNGPDFAQKIASQSGYSNLSVAFRCFPLLSVAFCCIPYLSKSFRIVTQLSNLECNYIGKEKGEQNFPII